MREREDSETEAEKWVKEFGGAAGGRRETVR